MMTVPFVYVWERCVCDRIYVLCAYDSSVASSISASRRLSMGKKGSPACDWDPKALLTPKTTSHILEVTHFYLGIKKANKLYSFRLSLGLCKPMAFLGGHSSKDVKGVEDRSGEGVTSSSEMTLTLPVLHAARPASWWETFSQVSPRSHKAAVDGLCQGCWPWACPRFGQSLPWILGYR